jgi:hypothetical protein
MTGVVSKAFHGKISYEGKKKKSFTLGKTIKTGQW